VVDVSETVTDGKGHLYVDIEDKDNIAVVDAKTLTNADSTYPLDCPRNLWSAARTLRR
jgi:hypothetical protein